MLHGLRATRPLLHGHSRSWKCWSCLRSFLFSQDWFWRRAASCRTKAPARGLKSRSPPFPPRSRITRRIMESTREATLDPATPTPGSYEDASTILYESLAGDPDGDGQPDPAIASYMQFKQNQLGSNNSKMFIKDPFGNSYGYSTLHETDPSEVTIPPSILWSTANSS